MVVQTLGAAIREAVPEWLAPAFLGITRLGNVALFLVVFGLDYWFVDRDRGAHAIGLVVGGMAAITALKSFFAVPRPPEAVNLIPIEGFSFPSGHAMGAAVAYGTAAHDVKVGPKRVRYAAAAVLVALIALSRVVLGVHFVRDVVFGVVFGVAFLAIAVALTGHDPRQSFALALGLGVVAFVISGASRDGAAVLGTAVGAVAVWELLDPRPDLDSTAERAALLGVVLPVLGAIGYVSFTEHLHFLVVLGLSVVLAAGLLGGPVLVERVAPD